jgi:hypothetical protein
LCGANAVTLELLPPEYTTPTNNRWKEIKVAFRDSNDLNTITLVIAANQRLLFPESRQLVTERASAISRIGERFEGGSSANLNERIDGGAGTLPLIVSLELSDGTVLRASDVAGEFDYRSRKPL